MDRQTDDPRGRTDGEHGSVDGEHASASGDPLIADAEREALHRLQLAIEHVSRAHGHLLSFHHAIGHAMDHFAEAETSLRSAGQTEYADAIRDRHLPAGVVGDRWSYEVVESFEAEFLATVRAFERTVRDDLADGRTHVTERAQQRAWRRRAQTE